MSYSCNICGQNVQSEDEMKTHMLIVHIEGCISCPVCDLSCVSADEMRLHVNTAHYQSSSSSPGSPSRPPTRDPSDYSSDDERRQTATTDTKKSSDSVVLVESPQRMDEPANTCPVCGLRVGGETSLDEHINTHFDQHTPAEQQRQASISTDRDVVHFQSSCPVCSRVFADVAQLTRHVDSHFGNGPSSTEEVAGGASSSRPAPALDSHPGGSVLGRDFNGFGALQPHSSRLSEESGGAPGATSSCPVCGRPFRDFGALQLHINQHFFGDTPRGEQPQPATNSAPQAQHSHRFQQNGSSGALSATAVYAGTDDGSTRTPGILPALRRFYNDSSRTKKVEWAGLSGDADHFGSSLADRGWACGYRNLQMLLSAMLKDALYRQTAFSGEALVPSIRKLQEMIEAAWDQGFDQAGRLQLAGKLANTRKWIGATEVVALLSSLHIKCQLMDFHRPTGPGGTHPLLFQWARDYFGTAATANTANNLAGPKLPVYLQHQGHSRTIVGCEQSKDGSLQLLLLDPVHSAHQMNQLVCQTPLLASKLRLLRRNPRQLTSPQYQLVAVQGILSSQDYQGSKILKSTRIP